MDASTPCPTCEGTGVVWEPSDQQESASASAEDALDLTYRP